MSRSQLLNAHIISIKNYTKIFVFIFEIMNSGESR